MGWRNTNIFAWSPQDVATFLDEIGLSGLKNAVLLNSITGPQLISLSPEEMSEQLGATPLQAQKIHAELNGLGSDLGSGGAAAATSLPAAGGRSLTEAEVAAAYNTAGTTGAFIDPRNPNQSLEDYYRSNQSLSGFQIGGAAAGAAGAAALYSPMGTTASMNAYPFPVKPHGGAQLEGHPGSGAYVPQQQQQLDYLGSSPPATSGGGAIPFNQGQLQMEEQQQQSSKDTYLDVCRSFFPVWLFLLLPLLLISTGDVGLTIYMNGKFSENRSSTGSEWGSVKSQGVYSPHYLNADTFWCILFFVAQGYTILVSIILIAFESTVGRRGTLSGTKNLAFATLLLSFLGLTLYTVPIVKWTYVIVTDYSFNAAFSDAVIPAVAFGLEWMAVLLWLVAMILAAVQLGLLRRKRYKL
ncbi:hypothetical protein NADE_007284 [Nannochloris sp. 'desiccata']|nr:hypothetical protein NADE_007284 [Chlorella desiccata (nom. nud.)]